MSKTIKIKMADIERMVGKIVKEQEEWKGSTDPEIMALGQQGAEELGTDDSDIDAFMEEVLGSSEDKDGVSVAEDEGDLSLDEASLTAMTVPELKDILKSKGLKVGGKKAELIERLLN